MMEREPLLSVSLSVDYPNRPGVLRDVCFQIGSGEVLALVGQSGSGKSTIALSLLRLLHMKGGKARGSVLLRGRDLMREKEREMRAIRGRDIGLVLQSPLSSLNPALRIGTQLLEAWRAHARGPAAAGRQIVREALGAVSLPSDDEFLRRYPGQLSVGQAQRVMIAMAVLHRPALLIADEPTSALDVITQAEILSLFGRLNRDYGIAILYISHDLLSVANISQRIAILHRGEIVEQGDTEKVFCCPRHGYTQQLVAAMPVAPESLMRQAQRRWLAATDQRGMETAHA
jgi:peptide/nickel transport system ATP-binding protein